jgi:hypothetical protein
MHAIDGGGRVDEHGAGFARLCDDVFGRPRLAVVPPALRVLDGGRTGAAAGRRGRRRYLHVVATGRR